MATTKLTSFRTSDEIRDKLTEAARARGVSVNQEINTRIEQSFGAPDTSERVFGSPGIYGLVKLLAVAMQAAGHRAILFKTDFAEDTRLWFRDPYAYDQARQAVVKVLEACQPPGSANPPANGEPGLDVYLSRIGHQYARMILTEIKGNAPGGRGEELRRDLDPVTLKSLETAKIGAGQ